MPDTIPCFRCEMKASCTRDRRCYRPCTVDGAVKELREALEVFNASTTRLNEAVKNLKIANAQATGQR